MQEGFLDTLNNSHLFVYRVRFFFFSLAIDDPIRTWFVGALTRKSEDSFLFAPRVNGRTDGQSEVSLSL